jgi:hypothetical protein
MTDSTDVEPDREGIGDKARKRACLKCSCKEFVWNGVEGTQRQCSGRTMGAHPKEPSLCEHYEWEHNNDTLG